MKKNILFNLPIPRSVGTVIFIVSVFMLFSCSKDENPGPQPEPIPKLSTKDISMITATTALCGGIITSDEGTMVISIGVCWSTNQTPTVSDNRTNDGFFLYDFVSAITGLADNTKYYLRAYAEEDAGISYGNIISFTTLAYTDFVTDIDSNVYHAVTIGTQVWTTENLKVTHYRNGDQIPNITDDTQWSILTTGAYCNFNNDLNYVTSYGRLYNWYAVDDSRNIAPDGWHVPSHTEWQTLIDYLGGEDSAGVKMREIGQEHWHWVEGNQTIATNESGFLALPAGERQIMVLMMV